MAILFEVCDRDASGELYIELVDALLDVLFDHSMYQQGEEIEDILLDGGSVWGLNEEKSGLERRVDSSVRQAYAEATAAEDTASAELAEAWSKSFGRHPDPSDAWDHAIKAIESLLVPIVAPRTGQIGKAIGQLRADLQNDSSRWKLKLPGKNLDHKAQVLVSMLELVYPNHDRHSSENSRVPSQEESELVVTLAITLVQWLRSEILTRA